MALAALTATLCFMSWSMTIESLTVLRMFLGVMLESAICCRLTVAFANFASFSCCFLILALNKYTWLANVRLYSVGISVFRRGPALIEVENAANALPGTPRVKMKLAAEMVKRGAAVLGQPCPQCGGIQVRYLGKVYCTGHEDLSSVLKVEAVQFDTVAANLREVLLAKLNEAAGLLEKEKDGTKQDQLASLMAKYLDLLQKLPQKGQRP